MPLPQEQYSTIEDIQALPDGTRAELIDGIIYDMGTPSRTHQRILGTLYRKIADYIDSKGGQCEVNVAPFAVYLNDDSYNYVEPDILVVCDPKKMDDSGCHGAPDWIIEVVSPASRKMDYSIKLFKYKAAGVREYWIIDPMTRTIKVHDFAHDDYTEYIFNDSVKVCIYDDLVIDFSTIQM